MKRSSSLAWLLSRNVPWLPWWQELLLNWISSWASITSLTRPDDAKLLAAVEQALASQP